MIRRLNLICGLILFAYVLSHLVNHALGLASIEILEAGRRTFLLFWRTQPVPIVLYGAVAVHMGLALRSIYRRRRFALPGWQLAQIILGLAIPPLLMLHILGTRVAEGVFGVNDTYVYILLVYFVFSPLLGFKQAAVLLLVWTHGCIGLHFWLRLKPWYGRAIPVLYAAALLVPVVSLLGFLAAGREVARLAQDPAWMARARASINFADAEAMAWIGALETAAYGILAAALGITLLARWARAWLGRRRGVVHVAYPDGRRVPIAAGTTILEASRGAGIAHASVCGGRGRCSTCRVRVGAGRDDLAPPSEAEARVLKRIGAAPNVRLACQTRPARDLEVTPLLPSSIGPRSAVAKRGLQGEEREVAVLFADLRDFTAMAENKLPYDVVFVLNRYFAAMGLAVEEAGGRVDKFIGDGVMALFGTEQDARTGCRNAISAARRMAERLIEVNSALAHDLDRPLRIGIGIHCGPAIIGEMGYGGAITFTAIGDAVNTASRLEALTKEFKAQLIVSEPVIRHAGVDLSHFPQKEIEVRGRSGALVVRVVASAASLPAALEAGMGTPVL